jgi:hypothetical protein
MLGALLLDVWCYGFIGVMLSLCSSLVLDATSRGATCNLKKLEKVLHNKVSS